MCNPLAYAALAATAAGTAATVNGQHQAEKAQVNVRRAEDARQAGFKQQAESAFAGNQQALQRDTIDEKMQSGQAKREAAYAAANAAAPRPAMAPTGSMGDNKVVQSDLAGVLRGEQAHTKQIGAARANLGSFGDAMFDTNLLLGRGREGIAQASNFGQGSLRATGPELEAAGHKGDKMRSLGTLLQAAGAVMSAGAGAAAAGAGSAAGAGTMSATSGMLAQPYGSMLAGQFGSGWAATPWASALL